MEPKITDFSQELMVKLEENDGALNTILTVIEDDEVIYEILTVSTSM